MLSQIPSLRIFLPFVAGIAFWQFGYRHISILQISIIAAIIIAILIVLQFRTTYQQFKNKWMNGLLTFPFFILFGYVVCAMQQTHQHPKHYSHHIADSASIIVKILDPIIAKPKSFKTLVQVKKIIINSNTTNTIGIAYLYFTQTNIAPILMPGDEILLQSPPILLAPNLNPGGFDYAAYSIRKGITHAIYITPKKYILIKKNQATIATFFANQKIKCLGILHQYITDSNAIGIADALLVGDRTLIDEETWDAYKDTGIVHIIAISGMHLGIVYHQLLWLLFLIPLFKKHEKMTIVLALIAMWAFSCLIGMPPSVARAGLIFTIMGIGKIINRKNYTYNSLIASAFILLCIEPNWILDVGFILSYAAIFGILLFAQSWQNIFYSKFKILQYINTTVATTLAAQVFTLPICLFYFHQFPALLLLSNLIAIIATTLILYAEIILLSLSWLPFIPKLLGYIITTGIVLLNKFIIALSNLPFFNIKHISISQFQFVALLVGITFLSFAIIKKKSKPLLLACSCIIVFFCIHTFSNWKALQQQKLIVHHTKYKSILQICNGLRHCISNTDSITKAESKNILEPTQIFYRANKTINLPLVSTPSYHLQVIHGKSILQLYDQLDSNSRSVGIDYVILCKNVKINLTQVVKQLHPTHIIIDGANSLWKIEQWENEASALHLPIYNTAKQGAFIADL